MRLNSSSLYKVFSKVNPGESINVIVSVNFIFIKSIVVFGIKLVVICLSVMLFKTLNLLIKVDFPAFVYPRI